jgi:ATP-dependent Clp protease ATP-binding subunit ClpA
MPKEELLKLLTGESLRQFDAARHLARARGGILSPLHLLVVLLENVTSSHTIAESEAGRWLSEARQLLASRYPASAESITVPIETQALLREAFRLAQSEGKSLTGPIYLMRAVVAAPAAKELIERGLSPSSLIAELEASEARTAPQPVSQTECELAGALAEYCTDLAAESRVAQTHPFIGREREVTAVLETLCRKLKNNPLLIGKPGVGKTALVIAVASRLCEGTVPGRLKGRRILEVSRLRLLADAKFSGDIEERLKKLLEEVRAAGNVILFFDEIHTLLSAGGAGGTGDVANLLKSSLSKGEITCIGATTLAEYYKYVARDEALARRFSTITIEEPSAEETQEILARTRGVFEAYHGITIDDQVIRLIIEMADRYLYSRSFPDKAFDLLDKSAAKATLAGSNRLTRERVTETLSETTGLPLEIMDEDPAERLQRLEAFLNAAVPGQERAARDIARVVRIAKLGLELRPEQPDGVFLFVGPEGVGKHEMATALAKFIYGSVNKIIEFDMSQFTETWSISRLIGAEPGYVGYSERSGLLSKAAEDNPHSVLYFRNIDVAHPVVQQFLGEAFEQGRFTDAGGARISLSNITIVMSLSQIGESQKPIHVGFAPENHDERNATGSLRISGSLHLRERGSAFGIIDSLAATIDEVIEFQVLGREATEKIIGERLEALGSRLESAASLKIEIDSDVSAFFANKLSAERKSLAQLERLLQDAIIIPFTSLRLDRTSGTLPRVRVAVQSGAVKVMAVTDSTTT